MKEYIRGASAILACESKLTTTNALQTPTTSKTVTLWDSEGTQVLNAQAMTEDSTGKLSYSYSVASDAPLGEWIGYFKAVSGSNTTIKWFKFRVLEVVL